MTDFRTHSILHFATNNHQPLFQASQREPWERGCGKISEWLTYGLITSSFESCLLRSGKIAQGYIQLKSKPQLPCQSCCVEVISLGDFSIRP